MDRRRFISGSGAAAATLVGRTAPADAERMQDAIRRIGRLQG